MFRADLHCHSTSSDGSLTPIELLDLALSLQLSGFSITDHDTVEAYKTALPYAKKIGIPLLSGIELSAYLAKESVHILAYAFDLYHPALQALCERHTQRRIQRNRLILEKLHTLGMEISEEEMLFFSSQTTGRPHIAQALLKKGYVRSIEEAFKKYLGEEGLAYAKGELILAEETIQVIHEAKGFAIIAHPHLIKSPSLLEKLLSLPFDGLEGYYSRFHGWQNNPFLEIAKKKNWIVTGGSDFHGLPKPKVFMGSSWTNETTFNFLYQHGLQFLS